MSIIRKLGRIVLFTLAIPLILMLGGPVVVYSIKDKVNPVWKLIFAAILIVIIGEYLYNK